MYWESVQAATASTGDQIPTLNECAAALNSPDRRDDRGVIARYNHHADELQHPKSWWSGLMSLVGESPSGALNRPLQECVKQLTARESKRAAFW